MRRAALVYNPIAGRRRTSRRVGRLASFFEATGWTVEARVTVGPGGGEARAREAAEEGFDAVLALGGDGTLRECAAGLLGSETALGFLPSGTTNVMTLAFGLPHSPYRAARRLAAGRIGEMDVGLCGETPFLMQASAGLDSAIIAALNPTVKRVLGKGAVGVAGLQCFTDYAFPSFELELDGARRTASFAAITNIPFYGGPWRIAPQARLDDGRLHAVLFSGRGREATLAFALALFFGRHLRRRDVEILPVEEARFPAVPDLSLQMDGDTFADHLPAHVRLASRRLRLLLPSRE